MARPISILDNLAGTEPVQELPFPEVVDNSMISNFKACEQKGAYSFFENLSPTGTSVHLHAGGAFAHGIEHARRAYYVEGRPKDEAIARGVAELLLYYGDYECPPESAKSAERTAGALVYYFDRYDLESDYVRPWTDGGNHGIEFSFSFPLPVPHPQTGLPIIYSGRFDMLGVDTRRDSGALFIVDEKTASSLGASWSKQWQLDSQFTGYCYGARLYGKAVVGAIIRGVSILKTKYDSIEAIIYRSDWELQRWHEQVVRKVKRMVEIWRALNGDPSARPAELQLDKFSCGSYGGCSFEMLCNSPHPNRWKPIHFEPRVWHPMLREEREAEIRALREAAQ